LLINNTFEKSIAALRLVTPGLEGSTVTVVNYYDQTATTPFNGPGGGGLYRWDPDSNERPNQGSVIAPNLKWQPIPMTFLSGRWLLVNQGFVNVRQFGALGVNTATPKTIVDLVTAGVFLSMNEVRATYVGATGKPFNGLKDDDTADWATCQAAIEWCQGPGQNLGDPTTMVRLEVNPGVYVCRRPLWIGNDAWVTNDETNSKTIEGMGFTMVGLTNVSREQADGGTANFRLTTNCTNRYALTKNDAVVPNTFFKLRFTWLASGNTTAILGHASTATEVKAAIETVLGVGSVELDVPLASNTLATQNGYFRINVGPSSGAFIGEVEVIDSVTLNPVNHVRCLPDCGIVSFRRSAHVNHRVENITLKGNNSNESTSRLASFGVLFTTSQFVGHVMERIFVAYCDTVVGILQGTGVNGEDMYLSRFTAYQCRRGLYCNAPQAYGQDLIGWNMFLDRDGVYLEFDKMPLPGVGIVGVALDGTFINVNDPPGAEGKGTMVKVRNGTGTINLSGGRIEHCTTLFDYDAVDDHGSHNNLDLTIRGMEFDGVRGGGPDYGPFVKGFVVPGASLGTNYGLYLQDCKFGGMFGAPTAQADIQFATDPRDDLRCVFDRCRFVGFRAFQTTNFRADFVRCYKNDFTLPGLTAIGAPLRLFEQSTGAPKSNTQSLRTAWQDTPWIQTGPRVNILKNSDLRDQTQSNGATSGGITLGAQSWSFAGGVGLAGFGKWGKFTEANITPSPEAFWIGLTVGSRVENVMDFVDLNALLNAAACNKVVTYQCLCRVKGKLRFSLVTSNGTTIDAAEILDDITVESPKAGSNYLFADTQLVTLRAQVRAGVSGTLKYPVLRIECPSGATASSGMQVLWQQAWGGSEASTTYPLAAGLANANHVRTPKDGVSAVNTYNWALNALSIRAAGRFQLPNIDTRNTADGNPTMGWKIADILAGAADLANGEIYYDDEQKSVMGRARDLWFNFIQPEYTVENPGNVDPWQGGSPKNLVYTSGAATVNLQTDLDKVPRGSVVRVFNLPIIGLTVITVNVENVAFATVSVGKMSEFLFYVDTSNVGHWLCVQDNVTAKRS